MAPKWVAAAAVAVAAVASMGAVDGFQRTASQPPQAAGRGRRLEAAPLGDAEIIQNLETTKVPNRFTNERLAGAPALQAYSTASFKRPLPVALLLSLHPASSLHGL